MARINPRRRRTNKFNVGHYLPRLDNLSIYDLVREAIPYLDDEDRRDLGIVDQSPSPGAKVGRELNVGDFVPNLNQEDTFDLVYAALPHLDEAEIFQLVMDELSPAGRARLLKALEDEQMRAFWVTG